MSSERLVVREIGGFSLVRELGQGGMGRVFLARQKSLDRLVALKVLQPSLAEDEEFLARFHREARAAALFQHPNVAAVIDAGKDGANGVHYIAFEFVDGGSLEDRLRKEGNIGEEEALHVTRGITQALAFAESKGIVHRDVKPDNILLGLDGTPKLADLGLAKQANEEAGHLTQTGIVMGTPLYMAPEQALSEGPLDIRADLYALGLCMWRMLTGRIPFDEDGTASSLAILTKHINEDLNDVRTRAPSVTEGTAQLIGWLSAREPRDRYQSSANVTKDIDRIMAGEAPLGPYEGVPETVSMESGANKTVPPPPPRRVSSRRAGAQKGVAGSPGKSIPLPLVGGVLLGALGIGIGLAVAFSGSPAAPPPSDGGVAVAPPADPGGVDEPVVLSPRVVPDPERPEPLVPDDPPVDTTSPAPEPDRPVAVDPEREDYRAKFYFDLDKSWETFVKDVPAAHYHVSRLTRDFDPERFEPAEAEAVRRYLELANEGIAALALDDERERREHGERVQELIESAKELPETEVNRRVRELALKIDHLDKFAREFRKVLIASGAEREERNEALFQSKEALVFGLEPGLEVKQALERPSKPEQRRRLTQLILQRNSVAVAVGIFRIATLIDTWSEKTGQARRHGLNAYAIFRPAFESTAIGRAIYPELRDMGAVMEALRHQGEAASATGALLEARLAVGEPSPFITERMPQVELRGPRGEAEGRGLILVFKSGVGYKGARVTLGDKLCTITITNRGVLVDEELFEVEWSDEPIVQIEPRKRELRVWVWNSTDRSHVDFQPEVGSDLGLDALFGIKGAGGSRIEAFAVRRMAGLPVVGKKAVGADDSQWPPMRGRRRFRRGMRR